MKVLNIGVMGCSSFAERAMIPALIECNQANLVCISSRKVEKAESFGLKFNCDFCCGYDSLLKRKDIDAVYLPLPTGLHEEWCMKALEAGKHILVEKSFAMNFESACRIINFARNKDLLVMENFQFQRHSQFEKIKNIFNSDELGKIRLIRSTFGFPPLPRDNFRWKQELGGGALLDTGAYVSKISILLLGKDLQVIGASRTLDFSSNVDLYGEAMLCNASGQVAQVAFGFDYYYQCSLELLGTKGKLSTNRIFTAPPNVHPVIVIEKQGEIHKYILPADNHYLNMWDYFSKTIDSKNYSTHWNDICEQSRLLENLRIFSLKENGI